MRAVRPLLLSLLVLLVGAPAALAATPAAPCTGDATTVQRLDLTVGGTATFGTYVLPKTAPRGIVAFGHGYTYNQDAFREHMRRAASRDGLVAVAMNYRGLTNLPADATTFERSRGFPVKPGGEDLVAATQLLDRVCGGFARRLLLGVSMGGNASGLSTTQKAKTFDGRPLFDYWVGVEGVYNLTETYNSARAVRATGAVEDIEKEAGGSIEAQPQAYAERTLVNRTADIAASGLKGIALVHGFNDGLVPYNQAVEFNRAMRQTDVPVDFYTATRKYPGDQADDTRLPGTPEDRPGHASEWAKHVVIDTGMDLIGAFSRGDRPPPCDRDFTVDGSASPAISPDPATPPAGCPAAPTFSGTSGSGGGTAPTPPGPSAPKPTPPANPVICASAIVSPTVSLTARRSRRTLRITGRAAARDCPTPTLRRVRIAIGRVSGGGRCRFVSRPGTGRLTRARSCTKRRIFLRPAGTGSFRLTARGLRPGRYRVTAVATDRDARRTASRTIRVR